MIKAYCAILLAGSLCFAHLIPNNKIHTAKTEKKGLFKEGWYRPMVEFLNPWQSPWSSSYVGWRKVSKKT